MRTFTKILKLIAILIVIISIILFSASLFFQQRVADIILKSLNNNISTKLEFTSFRLSFLKRFPKASIELKDVLVHSSSSFIKTGFHEISPDTLLAAKNVAVEFSISDIIKGNYNIDRINIKTGKLIILSDNSGNVNYEIKAKKDSGQKDKFVLNLERIILSDISAVYYNLATKLFIEGEIRGGRLKSKIASDRLDFSANSDMHITLFQLYNTKITKGIDAKLDLSLYNSDNATFFKKGSIKLDDFIFGLTGSISKDNLIDLNLTGQNIDISKVTKYMPDKLRLTLADYDPSGILIVNGRIAGKLSRTSNPHIEFTSNLNKGHIKYGKSNLSVEDLSFSGNFSNGSKNLPETSKIEVSNISLRLGSSRYEGSFTLSDFNLPETSVELSGILYPQELVEFFNIQGVASTEGSVDLALKLKGKINLKEKLTFGKLLSLNPKADLTFMSFSIRMAEDHFAVGNVDGVIHFSNIATAENLQFSYKKHLIKTTGEFVNLPEWLAGKNVKLRISANMETNRFDPVSLFQDTQRRPENLQAETFSLPEDIILKLNYKIDTFIYKTFHGEQVSGTLYYEPGILSLKPLYMNSLDGFISGNGIVIQNLNKSYLFKGNFNLDKIDINKAFKTFNNFGQNFLKAENLAGTLSGSLSLLLPTDSMLKADKKSLTAEGKYSVNNGALINFDPVRRLSSFIELSELENISFEKLENDFFIRNNNLYIPQMDVKSSAADLTINGKHDFDNKYEYHVKMLLSDILSKKEKKNRSKQSEFGIIEDDGLGRTSLLLKIESKGEDVKVGYDIKAAGNEIKKDIKTERQTLKTILNEEYGMFKRDTTLQKKEEKKPRFRIIWDESGNSGKNIPEIPAEDESSPVKKLFKKK